MVRYSSNNVVSSFALVIVGVSNEPTRSWPPTYLPFVAPQCFAPQLKTCSYLGFSFYRWSCNNSAVLPTTPGDLRAGRRRYTTVLDAGGEPATYRIIVTCHDLELRVTPWEKVNSKGADILIFPWRKRGDDEEASWFLENRQVLGGGAARCNAPAVEKRAANFVHTPSGNPPGFRRQVGTGWRVRPSRWDASSLPQLEPHRLLTASCSVSTRASLHVSPPLGSGHVFRPSVLLVRQAKVLFPELYFRLVMESLRKRQLGDRSLSTADPAGHVSDMATPREASKVVGKLSL